MNACLMLAHNCLELTKRAVQSVLQQDIPTWIYVIDNGSTDGTSEWLTEKRPWVLCERFEPQKGVSAGWNYGIEKMFDLFLEDKVLVLNNDVVLPPNFYRLLLRYEVPFITGVSVNQMAGLRAPEHEFSPPVEAPDFSAFLIRKSAWQQIGPFDVRMVYYSQDCDYHVRAHKLGIPLLNSGIPFYHERSSTIREASDNERQEIEARANQDRTVFRSKWGCHPWEPEYAELFR